METPARSAPEIPLLLLFSLSFLSEQVDNLQKENSAGASHLLPGISSITMESAMIMNNIQRIVQVRSL